MLARLVRLIWGGDLNPALRPVIAVSLFGSIAGSTTFPFLGIWAIKELHASVELARVRLPAGAILVGGRRLPRRPLSDRIGRRPLILIGGGCRRSCRSGCSAVGHSVVAGLTLLALLPVFGSLGGAADQAMVADLVPPEGTRPRTRRFASPRTSASRSARRSAALLLIGGDWRHLWIGALPLTAIAFAIAWRYIPRGGAYAPTGPPQRGSFRVIVRDHRSCSSCSRRCSRR